MWFAVSSNIFVDHQLSLSLRRDSKLAKQCEQLLSLHSVEPGLVLMNVPEGHSASAKVTHPPVKYLLDPSAESLPISTQQTRRLPARHHSSNQNV